MASNNRSYARAKSTISLPKLQELMKEHIGKSTDEWMESEDDSITIQLYRVTLKEGAQAGGGGAGEGSAEGAGEPAAPSPSRAALRTGHCASLHGGSILLFGGLNENSQLLDDITTVQLVS